MSNRGGFRPGAGRKKKDDSLVFKTVGLTPDQWEWLSLWQENSSPTHQLRELFGRSMKFWPEGPYVFGRGPKKIDESQWNQDSLKESA